MTVAQLIAELKGFDPDLKVHIGYNSGDYWGTVREVGRGPAERGGLIDGQPSQSPP